MTITGNKLKELEELKKKGQLIYPTSELSPDKVKELEELKKKGQLLYPLPPLKEPAPVPEPTVGQKTPEGKLPMQQIGQLGKAIPYTPPWKPQPSPEYIPSEEELKQRQEMERLIKESKEPATFSVQNAVTALRQEVERIPQPAKTIGAFLGYSFKSGINETDANIVWLANQFATGALSLTESIGELFGKPENWLEPTKLKTIQALTNVMNMYQQQAAVDIEKALSGVPMEQLSPAGQEVVAVLAESIGATVPVLTSLFAGMGMPQITGMAAQVSTWAPTINQFLRMTPFMVFGGTSHARDVENQLQQAGLSPDKAKTWGAFIVGGLFEGITESPVFEQLAKTMGVQGTKKLFSQLFTDIVVNAEQEAIMVPITKSYQQLLGLPQDWDAKNLITEMGRDGLAGAFMGLMLGVNVKGAKTSQQKLADILNKYNDGKIDVVQMVNEVDKVITQDKQLQKTLQRTYKESVTEGKAIPETKSEEVTITARTPIEREKALPPKEVETKGIPAELQPLAQEDTKYKTVEESAKIVTPGTQAVEAPIAPGTGEWKTRGLAEHVQRNIIAKDIEMIFEDLPQYQAVSSKQATDQIMQLIKQDYPRAVKMALGEEPVPQGILPGWIWTAVQNEATLRKDYETLNKLTSENAMMQFATILGQNVQAFADKNPVSVVAITHEISKAAEKRLEEKYPGKKIKDIKQRQEKKLKESIKEYAPKVDEWSRFIDSLVCP